MTRSKQFHSLTSAAHFLTERGFVLFTTKAWTWINPTTGVQADIQQNAKGYHINFGI